MRRVLICTVGGQSLPVVDAVRENAPLDLVYFLCSQGNARSASAVTIRRATTRESRARCPHCGRDFVESTRARALAEMAELEERQYVIEGIEDPDDLGQVVAACERIQADIWKRWRSGVEVIANYTGGTKTMSLGLGFYALGRTGPPNWTLQLNRVVTGGRTDLIGVRGGAQPVFQDSSKTLRDIATKWADQLAQQGDYRGALLVLSKAATEERHRSKDQAQLLRLGLRLRVQVAREGCDYAEALELTRQDGELAEVFGPRLEVLIQIVAALESDRPWPSPVLTGLELVDEMKESSERFAQRGLYAEAVVRMHRAIGLLAQLRLKRLGGPDLEEARSATRRISGRRDGPPGPSLEAAYRSLSDLGDPLGRYFTERRESIEPLLEMKRRSIYGEGLASIERESWIAHAPRWRAWLDGALEIL